MLPFELICDSFVTRVAREKKMNRLAPTKYRYRPLETERSIRLVTIIPGDANDNINLTIQHWHIDDSELVYEALPYTWGAPENLKLIYINHFAFEVTPNLFDALRRLRLPDKRRTLWVDAICINQEDIAEKSTQLPLMRDIYLKASAVVVWIGQADAAGQVEWAFKCFKSLAVLYMFWHETPVAATQRGLRSRVLQYNLPGVFCLLGRPWFEQAWTFQEICLSLNVEVICGPHSIPWQHIVCAIAAVRMGGDGAGLTGVQKSTLARVEYWALLHLVGISRKSKQLSLTRLLSETKGLATTDARDRIYSLLGLANVNTDLFQPDYSVD